MKDLKLERERESEVGLLKIKVNDNSRVFETGSLIFTLIVMLYFSI